MTGIFERPKGKRWPRSQKFRLSPQGTEAGERYREMIATAREGAQEGRRAFDAARTAWALGLTLQPGDGVFLGELLRGAQSIEELLRALEDCGTTRQETHEAVDRLTAAGLMEAVPAAPAPAPVARSWR